MQQSNRPYEGFFITIEGGDGCGKTTLCQQVVSELKQKGHRVTKTREPGGTPLSEHIRQLLLNPQGALEISPKAELLLYLAARAQNFQSSIKPALMRGEIVVCERFNDSTIAYQGCARNLGMSYVETLCHLVVGDPDFTLFLDLDPEEGMRRLKAGREESFDRLEQEKLQFHREVRQGYLHLADQYPNRIAILDASLPIEEVVKAALDLLIPHLLKYDMH